MGSHNGFDPRADCPRKGYQFDTFQTVTAVGQKGQFVMGIYRAIAQTGVKRVICLDAQDYSTLRAHTAVIIQHWVQ